MKAVLIAAALGLAGAAGAQGAMGMGAGPSGMAGGMGAAPSGGAEFLDQWRAAKGMMSFPAATAERIVPILSEARTALRANLEQIRTLEAQKASAAGDALATLRKRLEIAHAERDLIVARVETSLKDILPPDSVRLLMAAGFHAVSAGHSDAAMESSMGGGMGGMAPMSAVEDAEMKLAELAGKLNEGYGTGSLDEIIKDLGGR